MDIDDDSIQAFMRRVHAVQSMRGLWRLSRDFFAQFGIARLSYHHEAPAGAPDYRDVKIMAEGFPDEWVRHYVRDHLVDFDPIPNFARTRTMPFRWSEIADLTKLTPQQEEYLADMVSANLGDGLAVPVFGPGGRNGYVGLGFERSPEFLPDYVLREIQWACQIAHFKYCELLTHDTLDLPDLSPREREVLQWVARGKSNTIIADIVGISANTVDTHLRRIYNKLNVSDRTTAAIRGIGAGLIH